MHVGCPSCRRGGRLVAGRQFQIRGPSKPASPHRAKAHFRSDNCSWQSIGVQLVSDPPPDRPAPPHSRPAVPRWPLGSVDVSIPAQSTPAFLISPLPIRQTGRAICLLVPEIPSPGGPGPLIRCDCRRNHLCLPRHTSTRRSDNPLAFRRGLSRVLRSLSPWKCLLVGCQYPNWGRSLDGFVRRLRPALSQTNMSVPMTKCD